MKSGSVGASVPDFNVNIAGLTLRIHKAQFGNLYPGETPYLFAREATLKTPSAWGGLSQTVYSVRMEADGDVSIGGGKFRIPTIEAGGFTLGSLEGSLRRVGGSYEIAAEGKFHIVAASAGRCELNVNTTLSAGARSASVLDINSDEAPVQSVVLASSEAAAPDSLALREFGVGLWNCFPGIPVGNSGLFLTGVRGQIVLRDNIQSVSVRIQVQTSYATIPGGVPVIAAEAGAQVSRNRRNGNVDVLFDGVVKLIGVETAKTSVKINDRRFDATLEFNYFIINGEIRAFVGYSKRYNRTVYGGSGAVRVKIEKGAVWKKKICYVISCSTLKIPPFNWTSPGVNADFGTFKNGAIGFKGYVDVFGWDVGYYVDTRANISFGNVKEFVLITPDAVVSAKQRWLTLQESGQVSAASRVDERFSFAPDGGVMIDVPITAAGSAPQLLDVTRPVVVGLYQDVIFMMAQSGDDTLQMALVNSAGLRITPNNLPENVSYFETVDGSAIQSTYIVDEAMLGTWQIQVTGNTDEGNYVISVVGNEPAPQLSEINLVPADSPNPVRASWKLLTTNLDTKINIYATQEQVTNTVTLTDTDGVVSNSVVPNYVGFPIALDIALATDGREQSHPLDTSTLPSGIYSFWLEADDGSNPAVQGYLMQDGRVARVLVEHGDLPAWEPTITPTTDISNGEMLVEWDLNPHPDVGTYQVNLRWLDPVSPTNELTRTITVGGNVIEPRGSALVDGIEPGHTYHISICAEDIDANQVVCSPEIAHITPQPNFIVGAASDSFTVAAGETVAVSVQVQMEEALPYPVQLQANYALLPDGLTVLFDRDVVTSTAEMVTYISADEAMLTGHYAVPLVASSGMLERELVITVEVLPKQDQADRTIFLPLVANKD